MDYLVVQNRLNAGEDISWEDRIDAKGKTVIVIGGGDTGSDCVGTAIRQGAADVHQFEILPKPPEIVDAQTSWPQWPNVLRTSTSQEEGCHRRWSVQTKKLIGIDVRVSQLHACEVEWTQDTHSGRQAKELPGTDFTTKADLVLLAMGFTHVEHQNLVIKAGMRTDERGNLHIDDGFMTSEPGVFAAGDATSGASLVVRAIDSGRKLAEAVDQWLKQR